MSPSRGSRRPVARSLADRRVSVIRLALPVALLMLVSPAAGIRLPLPGAAPAGAATNLNGYWEASMGGTRLNDEHPWNLWRPSQYFEFGLKSGLSDRSEAFVKFGARWDGSDNAGQQPRFRLLEGHLAYRRDWGPKGFESVLFARERRTWIGNHLLQLVDENSVSNGNNAQGIRLDAWRGLLNATYILSDFSNQDDAFTPELERTDDAHILRLTRRLGDKGSYLRGSYLRRVHREPSRKVSEVRSLDFLWTHDLVDLSVEMADSKNPAADLEDDGFNAFVWDLGELGGSFENWLPSDAAFRAEARNVTLGNARYGHYTINAGYYKNGPDYRNDMGRDAADRAGHYFLTYYQLPERAVTCFLSWGRERHWTAFEAVDPFGNVIKTNDPRRWFNQSVYIEFIKGFKATLAHHRAVDTFLGVDYKRFDWIGELIVENRFAWLKTQIKIKDWDTQQQKRILGLETALNLSQAWKWYNRFMVANDAIESPYMLFTQIQYRPHDNMAFFLSYGPDWYGDRGALADDSDFESGGRMEDMFKLQAKTWF